MKKIVLVAMLLLVVWGIILLSKKDSNLSNEVKNEPLGMVSDIETGKGFIRSIDTVNGKLYIKIDPTEKESCEDSEGGDCEEDVKNTDPTVFSFSTVGDVQIDGFTCYVDNKPFKLNSIELLQNEINNFPNSKCGTYVRQNDWDNLLYLVTFNTTGEIKTIKSDPVHNQ